MLASRLLILDAHILRSEGRDIFQFWFWQFLVNLNKCEKIIFKSESVPSNFAKKLLCNNFDPFVPGGDLDLPCLTLFDLI